MKDKKHIIIVFSFVFIIIALFMELTNLLRPQSFDVRGHYRWNAVNEIISQKVVNQNINTCGKCHESIYQLHEKDAHFKVPCVDCHGAGDLHTAFHEGGEKAKYITKEQAKLEKEYTLEGCLYCHRKLKARPSDFPQIDQAEHYKFLNVKNLSTKCIECHSPHEPVFLLTEVMQSKLHPMVYKCTDCHNSKPKKDYKEVENHPKIFECRDCHNQIVKSFESKPHNKYVDCRTCHLFHKENESMGRIYKNGNAKFCLLCHQNKPFKDSKYPPKINWPEHLGKIKYLVNIDQKICLNCHANKIHDMNLTDKSKPHTFNWKTEHKNFLKNNIADKKAINACNSCHTKDFCKSCHKVDMPHSDDFKEGEHKSVVNQKGKKICGNCHNENKFCTNCH